MINRLFHRSRPHRETTAKNWQDEQLPDALEHALAGLRRDRFSPFFAERVVARIRREAAQQPAELVFFLSLTRAFRRVALAGTAIAVLVIGINFMVDKSEVDYLTTSAVSLEEAILPAFAPSLEEIL
ncbi:hypothetical protein JW992_16090 [candidate division KSB1 bacterium]|nr:hypothetical protein [candidate division KSB1 bacterium]